ncbi:MAG: hypothetical protein JXQ76_02290 [Campylobacterales bacterium]|nr:hypothetical protein [Campylobacterales bacterium]
MRISTVCYLIIALLMSACSGGGGGTSVEQEPLKTLYFIDAPVNGIDYKCGNREAKTQTVTVEGVEKHGVAMCRKGSVTFSIGNLIIGTLESYHDHQKIYLADFVDVSNGLTNNNELIKLGMLIQSLDDDGDIDNKIDIDTRVTLNIQSLDSFSVQSLQEYIGSLHKTPKDAQAVIEHIIQHIDPKYAQKPSVEAMQMSVSSSEVIGNTIGSLDIDSGDAPLLKVTLSGEGSEYFEIIDNKIRLKQKFSQAASFHLVVSAMNTFGEASGELIINVVNSEKIAKVELGQLAYATIKIYTTNKELIATTASNERGDFDLMLSSLDEQSFYIYEITGGQTSNSDVDWDGIKDAFTTPHQGVLRLILKKEWIDNAAHPIHASALSEMLYLYSVEALNSRDLDKKLDAIAKVLLQDDLNGDGKITVEDIILFNPSTDKASLLPSIQKEYDKIAHAILYNQSERFKTIFDTKVIKSFDKNASGCSPYTLCAFELEPTKIKYRNAIAYTLKDSRLIIYDTLQEKTLSFVDIPNTHYGLYLDLERGYIFLSASNQEILTVDMHKLDEPKLLKSKFSATGYILGKMGNHLFIYDNDTLIIADSTDMDNIQEIARYTLPKFDQIIYNDAYSFAINNNQLSITHYDLKDLANITQVALYTLNNISQDAKIAMDKKQTIYILTPNQSLGIYGLDKGRIQSISSLELNATEIINSADTALYAYGNRQIYQVDTSYLDFPRIAARFNFEQTTSHLYFDENILYTPRYLINLNALMLSSPYLTIDKTRATDKEYDIDLETIKESAVFDLF